MVDILEKTIEAQQKQIEELTFGLPQGVALTEYSSDYSCLFPTLLGLI